MSIQFPVKIKTITSSGGACPYQLEAITEDDKYLYLRYRGGRLRAGVSDNESSFGHTSESYNIINKQIGHQLDGSADPELFSEHLRDLIKFPDGFLFESFKSHE